MVQREGWKRQPFVELATQATATGVSKQKL